MVLNTETQFNTVPQHIFGRDSAEGLDPTSLRDQWVRMPCHGPLLSDKRQNPVFPLFAEIGHLD